MFIREKLFLGAVIVLGLHQPWTNYTIRYFWVILFTFFLFAVCLYYFWNWFIFSRQIIRVLWKPSKTIASLYVSPNQIITKFSTMAKVCLHFFCVCLFTFWRYVIIFFFSSNYTANQKVIKENDQVVLVSEFDNTTKTGFKVIRGTPEKLLDQLVDENFTAETKYDEDFLLTHRTFMPSFRGLFTFFSWFYCCLFTFTVF